MKTLIFVMLSLICPAAYAQCSNCDQSYNCQIIYRDGSPYYRSSAPLERQVLQNTGDIQSKFYTQVRLPNGKQTNIAVINGKLPALKIFEDANGYVVRLEMDYSEGYAFNQYGAKLGCVEYQEVGEQFGTKRIQAPHNPNLVGESEDKIPLRKVPRVNSEQTEKVVPSPKAPGPRNPNLDDEVGSQDRSIQNGSSEQQSEKAVPSPKAPAPVNPNNEGASNRYQGSSMKRLSDMDDPGVVNFPRYDR